jgi:hypothetical protein
MQKEICQYFDIKVIGKYMVTLQYFNGTKWTDCGEFFNEHTAWISLGDDNKNYRTVNDLNKVLTDKSETV